MSARRLLTCRSDIPQFIIQADFLTTSNREDILSDRPWNTALRDAVPDAFMKAVETFDARPGLQYNWLQYVPLHVSDDFMKPIVSGIKQKIHLRGADGGLYPPTNLITIPPEYQTELSEPLVAEKYLHNLRYLAAGYNSSRDSAILQHLGVKNMTAHDFISGLRTMDSDLWRKDDAWFERTCSALRSLANEWRSSYKGNIQALRLVPLEDGYCCAARESDIFFIDTSISVVPDDLSMRFVRRDPSLSYEHRRLLEDLGVKTATSMEICNRTLEHHRWHTPDKTAAMSHAKFLFQYSTLSSCTLDVRCDDDVVRSGSKVYMDSPLTPYAVPLSEVLKPYGAHFLHSDYYSAFPAGSSEAEQWFKWLSGTVAVNTAPRFDGYNLCQEFWKFAETPGSSVLHRLREYWPFISPKLSGVDSVLKKLSAIQVMCSDGKRHRLDETYIGRSTLRRASSDLLFADLEDAESREWDFLASLGVTFHVDGVFYLKQLIEHSKRLPSLVDPEVIVELYTQISARFDEDGNEDRIR